jgi:DNA polymerase
VGEQPGDHEDVQGRPFVGPSGEVLDRALAAAGIPRDAIYISESVKHFKHEIVGKRRIHRSPNSVDIAACRPWLVAEMQALRPRVIVCLGATAAQSVLGQKIALRDVQGRMIKSALCLQTFVTTHPAAILRQPDEVASDKAFQRLTDDLRRAWHLAQQPPSEVL